MVSLSLSLRVEANAEAFNAVESVGNLTKHRRAPMIIPTENGYKLLYVPAVSGESIANAYQRNLVEATKILYKSKPPLTEWDLRYEFSKFMDDRHLTEILKNVIKKGDPHEFEKTAIKESIVADVGGFLYAGRPPVKRTSRFYTGYMLPTYDSIEATAIEAQFHARHMPTELALGPEAGQAIYYVEVASALYGVTVVLDLDGIGRTSLVKVENAVDENERFNRIRTSLVALQGLFLGVGFGAKLTRFLPVRRIISGVAVVTDPIATTTCPAQVPSYIEETESKIAKLASSSKTLGIDNVRYEVIAYGGKPKGEGTRRATTAEEFFELLIDSTLRFAGVQKKA